MSKHSHGNSGGSKEETGETTGQEELKPNQDLSQDQAASESAMENNGNEAPTPETPELNATETGAVNWEQKSAELEGKLAELNDQYLRKAADFENFRKRVIREKQEISEFANQNLLLDLLPVIDDFERAIKSAETSRDFASFYEGITMIEKRLSAELENKWGLKRFDSEGQPFDPNRHEALQMEKAAGIPEAVVKEDYVKGYLLKNRVIRFAKVKVLMPDEATGNNP
jgi:molecular chaperone GrpE